MFSRERLGKLEDYLDEKKISEYLAEWGYYSNSNKYSCMFQGVEDLYPSFFVDDAKNVFYCHSCHRGGGTGKLIFYKIQRDYGIDNYNLALEKYLQLNVDIQNELGFSTLMTNEKEVKPLQLNEVISEMDKLLMRGGSLTEITCKIAPAKSSKDFDSIVKYCAETQNRYE